MNVLKYILPAAIVALQVLLSTNAALDAKVRPYVIQIRDLCLMIVPLDEKAFNKRAALKKVK